eukprot:3244960-Pleurochrysis_carterae.AAC.3
MATSAGSVSRLASSERPSSFLFVRSKCTMASAFELSRPTPFKRSVSSAGADAIERRKALFCSWLHRESCR